MDLVDEGGSAVIKGSPETGLRYSGRSIPSTGRVQFGACILLVVRVPKAVLEGCHLIVIEVIGTVPWVLTQDLGVDVSSRAGFRS